MIKYRDPATGTLVPLIGMTEAEMDSRYINLSGDVMTVNPTVPEPTGLDQVATRNFADTGLPVGVVMPFAGTSAPSKWMLCQGQAISRTTYSTLWSAITTIYGAGDGSTTFNIPDCRGRTAVGNYTGQGWTNGNNQPGGYQRITLNPADVPNSTGSFTMHNAATATTLASVSGNMSGSGGSGSQYHSHQNPVAGAHSYGGWNFNLGFSGGSHENMQPWITVNFIIKVSA